MVEAEPAIARTGCARKRGFRFTSYMDRGVGLLKRLGFERDGFELLAWLFGNGCTARIVLISGHDPHYLDMARKLCRDRGVPEIATVAKPSTLRQLTAAMGVPTGGIKPFAV